MAMLFTVNVELPLIGDGASTTFTYSMGRLFGVTLDTGMLLNSLTIPTSAVVVGTSGTLVQPTASIDSGGNLVLTFSSAWANGAVGTVSVQLQFASGATGLTPPLVGLVDGSRATYRAVSSPFFTVAATPTDVFIMSGSATKLVRINKILVQAIAVSSAGLQNLLVIRRSAANTGGTSVAITPTKMDTTDGNSTVATCQSYTANPTALGASAGTIDQQKILLPTSPNAFTNPQEFDLGQLPGSKSMILRGTSDFMAINLGGIALPSGGATISIVVQFTEE